MLSVPRLPVPLIAAISTVLLGAHAAEAGLQRDAVSQAVPTAIEQAVIDHVCRGTLAMSGAEAQEECLGRELLSLRADFGRDLQKLSNVERQTIDSACRGLQTDRGRDSYVACLSAQLVSVRTSRRGGRSARTAPASPAGADPLLEDLADPTEEIVLPDAAGPLSVVRSTGLWIGVFVVSLLVAGGGVVLAKVARHQAAKCRTCGASFSEPGDLCPNCRHEAAAVLRRAAAERVEAARAKDQEERRLRDQEEEQRQKLAQLEQRSKQEEEERLRLQEKARQDEARQREEEARRPQVREDGIDAEGVFDAYAVLGVPREASRETIEAAYQQAKAKYAEDQLEFLGVELQQRFRVKAEAVEKAYQMLTTQ